MLNERASDLPQNTSRHKILNTKEILLLHRGQMGVGAQDQAKTAAIVHAGVFF